MSSGPTAARELEPEAGDGTQWNFGQEAMLKSKAEEIFAHFYDLREAWATPRSVASFAWDLFLAASPALLPQNSSPALPYSLLVSCIHVILSSTPAGARCLRRSFSDPGMFPFRAASGAADTLACIISTGGVPRAAQAEVVRALSKLIQALDAFLAELVAPVGLHPASVDEVFEWVPEQERPNPQCRLFPGLVQSDGSVHSAAVAALLAYRQDKVAAMTARTAAAAGEAATAREAPAETTPPPPQRHQPWLPPLPPLLLRQASPPIGSTSPSPAFRPVVAASASAEPLGAVTPQGAAGGAPSTSYALGWGMPAADAQETAVWLQRLTVEAGANAGAAASALRGDIISSAAADRVDELLASLMDTAWPDNIAAGPAHAVDPLPVQTVTSALFYRCFAAVLSTERDGGASVATCDTLTASQPFFRGILALCVECVAVSALAAAARSAGFPASLARLHLCAFDLSKLIAPFVRAGAAVGMPRGIKRHFVRVEEVILESLAWQEGSSLYGVLRAATGTAAAPVPPPLCIGRAAPKPGDASLLLSAFVRKWLKLVALRLTRLVRRLDMVNCGASPSAVLHQAFTAARCIVLDETWLLYGRHMDHIVLCTLYCVCKLNQAADATFRSILTAYKLEVPGGGDDRMRRVSMAGPPAVLTPPNAAGTPSPPSSGIVDFYNAVFLPTVEAMMRRVASGSIPLAPIPAVPVEGGSGASGTATTPEISPWVQRHVAVQEGTSPSAAAAPAPGPAFPHALKLSPGNWRLSPRGMHLMTPPALDSDDIEAAVTGAAVARGQKRGAAAAAAAAAEEHDKKRQDKGPRFSSPVEALLSAAEAAAAEDAAKDGH